MFNHSFTEEYFKEFWNYFFQISDADSLKSRMKSSSAASFIYEDDESFIETIIFLVFYEIWKTQSLVLDEKTNQLYKLNKQQEDEIKKLKTRLQAKKLLLLISFTLSILDLKKYLILRCLLMKRTLLERINTKKLRIN